MKKWIGLMTAVACTLTPSIRADDAPLETTQTVPAQEETFAATPVTDIQAPKQVGKASADATNTARSSNVGKYVLAATAVAVGITALILVARHDGHK